MNSSPLFGLNNSGTTRNIHSSVNEHVRTPLINRNDNTTINMTTYKPKPPLAGPEIDDLDDDDRTSVTKPYPGVDDGFFSENGNHGTDNKTPISPDVENIPPSAPKEPEYPDFIPEIVPRLNPDADNEKPTAPPSTTDENDGKRSNSGDPNQNHPFGSEKPVFGAGFGHGHDFEIGSIPDMMDIPDVNVYQHKKTLAQGMMDLALFSANANQLRYVLESFQRHPYFYPSLILISISLILQVAVGIGLIWNATYNVKDDKEICVANRISNFTIIGIFLVTVINVFISAFGVANPAP